MTNKVELLAPAGDIDCFLAAIDAGANAVYLGVEIFSARCYSQNFKISQLKSLVNYAHKKNVKVYLALNTLVKNSELEIFFQTLNQAVNSGIDAVIIQSQSLVPLIRKFFSNLDIHLSTQATITNKDSVLNDVNRIIPARELSISQISSLSKMYDVEVFVHGALCISYSGQCLFSSFLGGRSGNRGRCAQPCRKKYNNKFNLSTMDLCLVTELPKLISSGVMSFKIEGRMRKSSYVYFVTSIYRKYIDQYYSLKDKSDYKVSQKDLDLLKLVFCRDFTKGFAFNDSILNPYSSSNNGLFIGRFKENKLKLISSLEVGDGVVVVNKEKKQGFVIEKLYKDSNSVNFADKSDIISLDKEFPNFSSCFKTSNKILREYSSPKINIFNNKKYSNNSSSTNFKNSDLNSPFKLNKILSLESLKPSNNKTPKNVNLNKNKNYNLFVKVYNQNDAIAADKAKADIIYYDITQNDFSIVKDRIKNSLLFCSTPRILDDVQLLDIVNKIKQLNPDGVLVSNPGILKHLNNFDIHLDYSFNIFNDMDIEFYSTKYNSIPIISPELSLKDLEILNNKNIIVLVHGSIIFMTTKEPLKAPELIDEHGQHFLVRTTNIKDREILNSKDIGLFNKTLELSKIGIKNYFLDLRKDSDKFIRIYKKILDGKPFDDTKLKKGYTLGHFDKGVL